MTKKIIEVFGLFAEWYAEEFLKTGKGTNMKDLGHVFVHEFKPFTTKRFGTHTWKVALNGQESELLDPIGNCGISPYHLHIYRDDWLVAVCTPLEGTSIEELDNQFGKLLKHLLKKKRKESIRART